MTDDELIGAVIAGLAEGFIALEQCKRGGPFKAEDVTVEILTAFIAQHGSDLALNVFPTIHEFTGVPEAQYRRIVSLVTTRKGVPEQLHARVLWLLENN